MKGEREREGGREKQWKWSSHQRIIKHKDIRKSRREREREKEGREYKRVKEGNTSCTQKRKRKSLVHGKRSEKRKFWSEGGRVEQMKHKMQVILGVGRTRTSGMGSVAVKLYKACQMGGLFVCFS